MLHPRRGFNNLKLPQLHSKFVMDCLRTCQPQEWRARRSHVSGYGPDYGRTEGAIVFANVPWPAGYQWKFSTSMMLLEFESICV
jgi:hypothetical protein